MVCGQYNSRELGFSIITCSNVKFCFMISNTCETETKRKKVEIQQMLHVFL